MADVICEQKTALATGLRILMQTAYRYIRQRTIVLSGNSVRGRSTAAVTSIRSRKRRIDSKNSSIFTGYPTVNLTTLHTIQDSTHWPLMSGRIDLFKTIPHILL